MPAPDESAPPSSGLAHDGSSSRTRKLIAGIISSFGSRGVAAIVPLVMIPLTLPALGTSLYGAWMTVMSLTAMLIWADLGLGSGLLTRMSASLARGDYASCRRDTLAAYGMVGGMAALLAAVGTLAASVIDWSRVLGTDAATRTEATAIVLVCLWCFTINMPLSLIVRVQYASNQVSVSNAFTASGPVASLALTALAVSTPQPPWLVVLAATAGPLLANLTATIWFYARHSEVRPRWIDRKGAEPVRLLTLGLVFVVLSACSAFAGNLDNLIIARLLGSEAVATFSVPFRIMAALGLVINLVNLPLWPANANALAQGEVAWVRRTTRRMAVVSGGFVMLSTGVLLLLARPATDLLARGEIEPDLRIFLALGAWWTVVAWTSPFMMVQNAAGVLRWQLLGWVLFLAASVPLKILAVDSWGVWAGPAVGAVVYLVVVVPLNQYGYRRATRVPTPVTPSDVVTV